MKKNNPHSKFLEKFNGKTNKISKHGIFALINQPDTFRTIELIEDNLNKPTAYYFQKPSLSKLDYHKINNTTVVRQIVSKDKSPVNILPVISKTKRNQTIESQMPSFSTFQNHTNSKSKRVSNTIKLQRLESHSKILKSQITEHSHIQTRSKRLKTEYKEETEVPIKFHQKRLNALTQKLLAQDARKHLNYLNTLQKKITAKQ